MHTTWSDVKTSIEDYDTTVPCTVVGVVQYSNWDGKLC